ncbi:class I SAM-dependent methyltransferase [uncultured Rhodospira sp.]|uniref:class I SAM-dependent methyltransferase n=1 Tax=uncultured Rhodospira sp. TaxID=1936189 RepID=UPI0026091504|nr:class I SAM-dependent methyltransferase [uncultured Rhodospira sp.]
MTPTLSELLTGRPATTTLADAVLKVWPEHEAYLTKSLSVRDAPVLEMTEWLAEAAVILGGDRLHTIAENYRWTCDRLREEELHFHRHGSYRLTTFEAANAEVYSDDAYMERYIDGLLLSQVFWSNHVESCNFYFREVPKVLKDSARLLEIGPGHGLMLYLSLKTFGLAGATAWDISPVSVDQSRRALERLGASGATFAVQDIMQLAPGAAAFDLVVMSEVLEHLEDPRRALTSIRNVMAVGAYLFVNVPINSPSPDHIYLLETVEDVLALVETAGFRVVSHGAFASQGKELKRALRQKISVSVCVIAVAGD